MIFNVAGHIEMIRNGLSSSLFQVLPTYPAKLIPEEVIKTQTRRLNRGIYQVGKDYAVQRKRGVKAEPDIRIVMDRIWEELPIKWEKYILRGDIKLEPIHEPIKFYPINEKDAWAEGGYSAKEYEKTFREINPKWADDVRYGFEFHVIEVQR